MRAPLTAMMFLSLCVIPDISPSAGQVAKPGQARRLPFSPAVKAGDFIYLSGALATGPDGGFAGGDIRTQTRQVLDNLAAVVDKSGSKMERAVSVTVYLRSAADFQAMNEVYRNYWKQDPPVRTTVVANLALPEALVEISLVAVREGFERRIIHPEGWLRSPNPYSYGIRCGDTLFLAGLIARNGRDNSFVAGDMKAQTRTVMESAGEVLKAGGMTFADVAASRVYITDSAAFQDMNAVYRGYFPKDPPVRATVRTGLMNADAVVEISLLAVRGAAREAIVPPNPDGSAAPPNQNLSPGIRIGDRLYLSGMLGSEADNRGDAGAQTRVAMARIARTLQAAGFGWQDAVDATVYITDMKNMGAMNAAYQQVFTGSLPARVTAETGLMSPDAMVEIMVTAFRQRDAAGRR